MFNIFPRKNQFVWFEEFYTNIVLGRMIFSIMTFKKRVNYEKKFKLTNSFHSFSGVLITI